MMERHRIRAVGVVIPARDEQDLIGGCLASVDTALAALPAGVATAVWVVVDRSTDATAAIAGRHLTARDRRGYDLNHRAATIGAVRHHGVDRVLRLLPGHPPEHVWLLHTDADTRVAPDWALAHVRYADAHASAVAGTAELDTPDRLHPTALDRYERLLADGRGARRHDHVYGANLGIRADVYDRIGGFSAYATGEDRDLVSRVARAGHRVVQPLDVRVTTSGRLTGRADGGLAGLLASLNDVAGVDGRAA